ncbi:calcium-binding protein [Nocardioides terrigena]|uniref:calcium-binding protein n=1 Tax=Nocardioides terrigena TaxID=424797 RepID=UPI00131F23B1|nr:calcium-binding protein [Nocardioides terrigena]
MMRKATTTLTGLIGLLVPLAVVGAMGAGAPAHAAEQSCDGRPATIVATVPTTWPIIPVVGTPGDDVIVGTSGHDRIDGAGGNDVICGLAGGDHLTGGEGDDRLFGGLDGDYDVDNGYPGDLLVPGPGNDHVDIGVDLQSLNLWEGDPVDGLDRISYADSAAGVTADLATGRATGEGRDTIVVGGAFGVIGSPFDDHLTGTDEMNFFKAGAGADTIVAGDGDDVIWPDETIPADGAPEDRDVVEAGDGRDRISFSGGDAVDAGPGNDHVFGSSEARGSVSGGTGRDWLHIEGSGAMAVRGGAGNDHIIATYTHRGRYALDGGSGRDNMSVRIASTVPEQRITVDVSERRISLAGHRASVRLSGVETLHMKGKGRKKTGLTYIGSNRDDSFAVGSAAFSVRAHGLGGNDSLGGGNGRDFLDGGPGRDTLDGNGAVDRCVNGEKTSLCEIRR